CRTGSWAPRARCSPGEACSGLDLICSWWASASRSRGTSSASGSADCSRNFQPKNLDMQRLVYAISIAALVVSAPAGAQQAVPPAAPTIGASGGVGGGIAIPIGSLSNTQTAGYTLSGLVDFSAAEQPYSFRAELIYQRYDRKASA